MSNRKTFAIFGAGNVGVGIAADIESRGDKAVLYATPGHDRVLNKIKAQGYIEATQALVGIFYPEITHDLSYLISCSDTLVIALPSTAHESAIRALTPYAPLLYQKNIVFISGNGVAPLAHKALELDNAFETSRAPHTVRVEEHPHGLTKVRINGFKTRVILGGVRPPTNASQASIHRCFGMNVEWYGNIAEVLFVNNHGMLHAATMLRNQESIREQRALFFYRDCMTPAVCDEMNVADAELAAIAKALGIPQRESLLETLNGDYGLHHQDLRTFVTKCEALNRKPALPANMKARQITQDVQLLCVLWAGLARAVKVPTPVIDSWIDEASEINGVDYWKIGRTLQVFGLGSSPSPAEVRSVFVAGRADDKFDVVN